MSAALNSLLQRSSIDDHDQILKQCNETLKQNKNDIKTLHIKVVALLQLSRFNDAVRTFDQAGDDLKDEAILEYAYTLYKSGEALKAQDVVRKIESRAAKLLQAQISYKLGDFLISAEIYEALSNEPQAEENDLRVNLNATYAQLTWEHQGGLVRKKRAEREDLEAFETAYNAACMSIARCDFGPAEMLLRRAKELCDASEDLSSEQKQEEILSIKSQQLYVLHTIGKRDEAEELSKQIASEKIPDASTRHISIINKLVISGTDNPYLTQRQLEITNPSLQPSDKLFKFQEFLARKNKVALDLSCSKLEGIKRSTNKQIASSLGPSIDPTINIASSMNATAHAQSQVGKQGLKAIMPLLEKRPYDVGLVITILHIHILTGNNVAAINVLEKFFKRLDEMKSANYQDVRFNTGLIAIAVSLYASQGRKSNIRDELVKAASYWKTREKPPSGLLKAAGISLLETGDLDDIKTAEEIFQLLNQLTPNDRFAQVGLAASSSISSSPSESETGTLTTLTRLLADVDVSALEKAGIPRSSQSTAAILKRKRTDVSSSKPKKKRLRKSKLPKEFDLNKKLDPERWLPLRDRSTYRPKGRKGKQKQSTATQGSNDKSPDNVTVQEKTTVATASSTGGKAKKKKVKR